MRILLVEDTDSLRYLFARVLKGHGFEVCEAPDGLAALACLAHFRPEVVLTDLMMPSLDGIGFIRQYRAMAGSEAAPVVAMTAMPSLHAECDARQAGAADFLTKPFDTGTLLLYIAAHCGMAAP